MNNLAAELESLEKKYRAMVKINPVSIQETRSHLAEIDKIVRRMKSIRNSKTIGITTYGNSFLNDVLRKS